jgi:hypothetical protein
MLHYFHVHFFFLESLTKHKLLNLVEILKKLKPYIDYFNTHSVLFLLLLLVYVCLFFCHIVLLLELLLFVLTTSTHILCFFVVVVGVCLFVLLSYSPFIRIVAFCHFCIEEMF